MFFVEIAAMTVLYYFNIPKRFIAESELTFRHPHEHICHIKQYDN